MTYAESVSPDIQNVTVNEPSNNTVEITGLQEGTPYRIRIAGFNTRGIGAYSKFAYNTTYSGNHKCQ